MTEVTRHLITFAVDDYRSESYRLSGVAAARQRIACALAGWGYEHVLELGGQPSREAVFNALHSLGDTPTSGPKLLVLYALAHGHVDSERRFSLLTRDHGVARLSPSNTLIASEDLARALHAWPTPYDGMLWIFDSCFAATAVADVIRVAERGGGSLRSHRFLELLATTTDRALAHVEVFSSAFQAVLAELQEDAAGWRRRGTHIPLPELFTRIDARMAGQQADPLSPFQKLQYARAGGLAPEHLVFFRNPHHDPDLPMQQTLEFENLWVASSNELNAHWLEHARGMPGASRVGWYFHGRSAVLDELHSFFGADENDGRIRVVTGSPGAGKSAVLSQLVLSSHPTLAVHAAHLASRGQPLRLHASLWSRAKSLVDLIDEVASAAGIDLADSTGYDRVQRLLSAVAARRGSFNVVVDALDEADEPLAIARELLTDLGRQPNVRLVVGTRREFLTELGPHRRDIDLDLDDVSQALPQYVEARLLRSQEPDKFSPYRDRPALVRAAAAAIAARATPLFLVAQLIVDEVLARESELDLNQCDWLENLPRTVGSAFARYLDRVGSGRQRERVVGMLLALAHAQGAGLPRSLWSSLASALMGQSVTDADVDTVCNVASAYIVHDREQGEDVYRIYHAALAEHVRAKARLTDAEGHRRIASVLVRTVPEHHGAPDFGVAGPYVRAHLSTHASRGGVLAELLCNPTFLIAAEPVRVLAALRATRDVSDVGRVYEHALHHMLKSRPGVAAAYLQLSARKLGADRLAARIDEIRALAYPWSVRWARWMGESPHRLLASFSSAVLQIAVTANPSENLVLARCHDGSIYAIDARTGSERRLPVQTYGEIAALQIDGHSCVVAAHDGQLVVWNLRTRSAMLQIALDCEHLDYLGALEIDGQPYVLLGSMRTHPDTRTDPSREPEPLQLWNLRDGSLKLLRGHARPVFCLATLEHAGQQLVVSADGTGELRWWNPKDGSSVVVGHDPTGATLFIAAWHDSAGSYVLTGTLAGALHCWDLSKGELYPLLDLDRGLGAGYDFNFDNKISCVTPLSVDGVSSVVAGFRNGGLEVWNLRDGCTRARRLYGHTDQLNGVATLVVDEEPMVVSGSRDGTVRLWNLRNAPVQTRSARDYRCGWVSTVVVENEPLAIAASSDAAFQCWNLIDGSAAGLVIDRLPTSCLGLPEDVLGTAALNLRDRACIISGSYERMVWIYDTRSRSSRSLHALEGDEAEDNCVFITAFEIEGDVHVVSTGGSRRLRVWSVTTGANRIVELEDSVGSWAIAALTIRDEPYIFAVRTYEPNTVTMVGLRDGAERTLETLNQIRRVEGRISQLAAGIIADEPFVVAAFQRPDGFPSPDTLCPALQVWSLRDSTTSLLDGHEDDITCVTTLALQGRLCAVSGSRDKTLRVWDLRSATELLCIELGAIVVGVSAIVHASVPYVVATTTQGLVTIALASDEWALRPRT